MIEYIAYDNRDKILISNITIDHQAWFCRIPCFSLFLSICYVNWMLLSPIHCGFTSSHSFVQSWSWSLCSCISTNPNAPAVSPSPIRWIPMLSFLVGSPHALQSRPLLCLMCSQPSSPSMCSSRKCRRSFCRRDSKRCLYPFARWLSCSSGKRYRIFSWKCL